MSASVRSLRALLSLVWEFILLLRSLGGSFVALRKTSPDFATSIAWTASNRLGRNLFDDQILDDKRWALVWIDLSECS